MRRGLGTVGSIVSKERKRNNQGDGEDGIKRAWLSAVQNEESVHQKRICCKRLDQGQQNPVWSLLLASRVTWDK